MKKIVFFLFCLFSLATYAQDTSLRGKITDGEKPLAAAHILNLSQRLQTISNEAGLFEIPANVSDTLVVSFLGYGNFSMQVNEEHLLKEELSIVMTPDGIALDEVTLEYNKSMDAVALGLITKRPKQLSTNERKLEEAGDFKAIQLLGIVGGGVPIIPMINKITGRTKKLKERVAVENENKLKEYLKYHYSPFCHKTLGLEGPMIDRFLYYAVINGSWDDLYPNGRKEQFQFRLIQIHQKYIASGAEQEDDLLQPVTGGN